MSLCLLMSMRPVDPEVTGLEGPALLTKEGEALSQKIVTLDMCDPLADEPRWVANAPFRQPRGANADPIRL